MDPFTLFITTVCLPAVVALLVLALVTFALPAGRGLESLALLAAFVAAVVADEVPAVPPAQASDWLPWMAVAASALTIVEESARLPRWLRLVLRLLLVSGALFLSLNPPARNWSTTGSIVRMSAYSLATLAIWSFVERVPAQPRFWLLFATALLGAATFLFARTLTFGKYSAALAGGLFGLLAVAWWRPAAITSAAVTGVCSLVMPAMWLQVLWFGPDPPLPMLSLTLLFAAPLATPVAVGLGLRIRPVERFAPLTAWPTWVVATAAAVPAFILWLGRKDQGY